VNEKRAWWVYEPQEWERSIGYTVNPNRCRYAVHRDYGVGFSQCTRRPIEDIRGYRYCKQHAKLVREIMEGKR